jgi:hypothetical protein
MGAAWEQHGVCELTFSYLKKVSMNLKHADGEILKTRQSISRGPYADFITY